jgi:hypothetical protein
LLEKMGQVMKVFEFIQRVSNKDYFLTGIFGGLVGTAAMDVANYIPKN